MFNLFLLFSRGAIGFHSAALSLKSWRQFFFFLSKHKRSIYPVVVQKDFFPIFLNSSYCTSFTQHLWRKVDNNLFLVMQIMRLQRWQSVSQLVA